MSPQFFVPAAGAVTKDEAARIAVSPSNVHYINPPRIRLILALVHQRAFLDPRHHVAQLSADLLNRMRGELGPRRLERGLVDLVLKHPIAGEAAGLDVVEHP